MTKQKEEEGGFEKTALIGFSLFLLSWQVPCWRSMNANNQML
jgi:hypothetical protein